MTVVYTHRLALARNTRQTFPVIPVWKLYVLMFLCALTACASAAVLSNAPNLFIRVWPVESGLPQNKVTSVVQTHDGYLWIGTYSGLARFDGLNFTVFDEKSTPEMASGRVTSLFEADDGTLWIGHEDGRVTAHKDGQFRPVTVSASWRPGKICSITADDAGEIWVLNESGLLARLRDGLVLSPPPGTASKILAIARARDGGVWVARDGRLSILRQGQLTDPPFGESLTKMYVQGICASHDGGLWVNSGGRLRKWKENRWVEDEGSVPWNVSPLMCLIETQAGALVAGTADSGFYFLFPGGGQPLHLNRFKGYEADWIMSVLEDREGDLWVGTGGNGLIELRPSHICTLQPPDHWRGRPLLSIWPGQEGEIWFGTEGAGLYEMKHDEWTNFGTANAISNSYIWSVTQDAAGRLWVGTWGGGLFLREGNHFKFAPGMEGLRLVVTALLPARDGGLWVGTSLGLLRYQNGQTNWFTEVDGQSLRDVRTIAEDANGVWFGTAGNGLARLHRNKITRFHRRDGLPSDYIECLRLDESGALWIGTFGGGLCRLKDGKFSTIDSPQGLPNSVIGDIEDDGRGYYWMTSHGGIFRTSKKELNDCADGKIKTAAFLTYGINDGLPTIECSEGLQPAGGKTPDGRLLFPTSKGLVVITPNEVRFNQRPPPMVLEKFLVDGRLMTNLTSPLKISPGAGRFEFHFTALSFVAPEKVRFRYRIEGLEKKWTDCAGGRVANYNFLPPGKYVFHAIACNNDGVWNDSGVSLPFILLPHFWQTLWFRFVSGLIVASIASGLGWFETRRRLQRRLEKLEREKVIERERSRIAKDIHDDLGACLTRITMLSQSARGEAQLPEPVAKNLDRIFGTARELTRAMDEIVWAVNPRHDTLDSLANYLSRFAYDFLSAAEIRCRLDVPLQLPALPVSADVRHNLFLAFKEALNNVVKHAAADAVQVQMNLEPRRITLSITDNGRGLTAASPANTADRINSGNGLVNMTRRLAEIGGTCDIEEGKGVGVTVKFSVPLPREINCRNDNAG